MSRSFTSQWNQVVPGDEVRIRLNAKFVQDAIVDACSSDGAFIWVFDSLGERKLLHEQDGYEVTKIRD